MASAGLLIPLLVMPSTAQLRIGRVGTTVPLVTLVVPLIMIIAWLIGHSIRQAHTGGAGRWPNLVTGSRACGSAPRSSAATSPQDLAPAAASVSPPGCHCPPDDHPGHPGRRPATGPRRPADADRAGARHGCGRRGRDRRSGGTAQPRPGRELRELTGVTDREREVLRLVGLGMSNAGSPSLCTSPRAPSRRTWPACWPSWAPGGPGTARHHRVRGRPGLGTALMPREPDYSLLTCVIRAFSALPGRRRRCRRHRSAGAPCRARHRQGSACARLVRTRAARRWRPRARRARSQA